MSIDVISGFIGLILTLLVFSYLIGDNPLFRFTIYLFIGVSSGYAAVAAWHYVLWPKLFSQLGDRNQLILLSIPLVLTISLLAKLSPRISWMGNFAMAVLVGVGAATAVAGALIGTLLPQAQAAINAFALTGAAGSTTFVRLVEAGIMLLGTVLTLAAFHYTVGRAPDGSAKPSGLLNGLSTAGRVFVSITLGVLFAGVYIAALTAMIERLSTIIHFTRQLIGI
ncbi:MAG: hypothetical protein ACM3XO_25330 [Bacteroidota bacterium]